MMHLNMDYGFHKTLNEALTNDEKKLLTDFIDMVNWQDPSQKDMWRFYDFIYAMYKKDSKSDADHFTEYDLISGDLYELFIEHGAPKRIASYFTDSGEMIINFTMYIEGGQEKK